MAKYGRIKKKGLDNCQDPAIMDVKDWLFLQFATDAFVQFVADATDCFRCDLQERGYLF